MILKIRHKHMPDRTGTAIGKRTITYKGKPLTGYLIIWDVDTRKMGVPKSIHCERNDMMRVYPESDIEVLQ